MHFQNVSLFPSHTQSSGLLTHLAGPWLELSKCLLRSVQLPQPTRHPSPRFWTLQDLSPAFLLPSLIGHLRARGLFLRRWAAAVPPSNDDETDHSEKLCFERFKSDSAVLRERLLSHTWGLPGARGLDGARGGCCCWW